MAIGLTKSLFIFVFMLATGYNEVQLESGLFLPNYGTNRSARLPRQARMNYSPRRRTPPTPTSVQATTDLEVPEACNTSYDAVALIRNEVFIFKGKYLWRRFSGSPHTPHPIETRRLWSALPTNYTHVDAVYERPDMSITFFVGKQLYVFNGQHLLPGYPRQLTSLGLPESLEKLDAAMVWGLNNKTYLFSGSQYWRFDESDGQVELDYPRSMTIWKGVAQNIDSVFTWKDGKTYFFKDKGYWKFDNLRMQVEFAERRPSAQLWMGCPEESDESTEPMTTTLVPVVETNDVTVPPQRPRNPARPVQNNSCILPQYPLHGTYKTNIPDAKPGEAYDFIAINITCQEGFAANGPIVVICYNGLWVPKMPQCVSQCRLPPHPSVAYNCLVSLDFMDGYRVCNEYEMSGTTVRPVCQANFYTTSILKYMHCINGEWSSIQTCIPECGTLIPNGTGLVLGGDNAYLGEVPWHAGIYTKTTEPYQQICGGSLISTNTVISAAHCFWDDFMGKLPASEYAVAVGKLYRNWTSNLDHAQSSDVESLHLPTRFRGSETSYQDDIAVVVLRTPVAYSAHIRPVCLDFNVNFERRQLQARNMGKVAGWGLTAENGNASQTLRVLDLPYITVATCLDKSPVSFHPFITSDKICAGYENAGKALCRGDSGGGLAFPERDRGTLRYYLRGIASTAPSNDNLCNANTFTSFTRLINHEYFITRLWGD